MRHFLNENLNTDRKLFLKNHRIHLTYSRMNTQQTA